MKNIIIITILLTYSFSSVAQVPYFMSKRKEVITEETECSEVPTWDTTAIWTQMVGSNIDVDLPLILNDTIYVSSYKGEYIKRYLQDGTYLDQCSFSSLTSYSYSQYMVVKNEPSFDVNSDYIYMTTANGWNNKFKYVPDGSIEFSDEGWTEMYRDVSFRYFYFSETGDTVFAAGKNKTSDIHYMYALSDNDGSIYFDSKITSNGYNQYATTNLIHVPARPDHFYYGAGYEDFYKLDRKGNKVDSLKIDDLQFRYNTWSIIEEDKILLYGRNEVDMNGRYILIATSDFSVIENTEYCYNDGGHPAGTFKEDMYNFSVRKGGSGVDIYELSGDAIFQSGIIDYANGLRTIKVTEQYLYVTDDDMIFKIINPLYE